MNNRDPFNVRQHGTRSPVEIVQNPGYYSNPRNTSNTLSVGQLRHLPGASQSTPSPDDPVPSGHPILGMSEANSGRQRSASIEQGSWQPRRAAASHSMGDRVGHLMGGSRGKDELPMYKDKPYNYAASRKSSSLFKKLRPIFGILVLALLFLYWTGSVTKISTTKIGIHEEGFKKKFEGLLTGETLSTASASQHVDWNERQERVRDAFRITWAAYEEHAWGYDIFKPTTKQGEQMVPPNGLGWIIVDALDTMIIMNLTTELAHAREWVSTTLNYDVNHDVSTFETTIRMLGGLLSAHYLQDAYPSLAPLSGSTARNRDLYLEKASDLADRLMGAYDSQSGVPFASVNLRTREGIPSHDDGGASSTAEAASLQLEMKYLASLTGEKTYWDAAEKIMQVIDDNGMRDGLLPIFIYANEGTFRGNSIRLGSRGDSYYEYLIKQYLQTNEPIYLDMWNDALEGIKKHMITYTKYSNLTILAELPGGVGGPLFPKMDHLVCFMPGTIALAATKGRTLTEARKDPSWGHTQERDMDLARELMKTCWGMYEGTATGLSPEIAHFRIHEPPIMFDRSPHASAATDPSCPAELEAGPDGKTTWRMDYDIHGLDFHNVQRPETAESLFYMWRITGDTRYREWGWRMFEAFVRHTSVPNYGGFTSIRNVDHIPTESRDNMESFWLAETLKYLFLLFGPDDVLPLTSMVLNTEAHPLPVFDMGKLFSTGWKRKPRDENGYIVGQAPTPQQ